MDIRQEAERRVSTRELSLAQAELQRKSQRISRRVVLSRETSGRREEGQSGERLEAAAERGVAEDLRAENQAAASRAPPEGTEGVRGEAS